MIRGPSSLRSLITSFIESFYKTKIHLFEPDQTDLKRVFNRSCHSNLVDANYYRLVFECPFEAVDQCEITIHPDTDLLGVE